MAAMNNMAPQYPWNAPQQQPLPGWQQRMYNSIDQPMNSSSQPGLSIVPINSDDQVTNYPVASGNTVAFINFNNNRICFKSTNVNGVPTPLQWASFTYDQPQVVQQNIQNSDPFATKEELNELKVMLQQLLNQAPQHDAQRQQRGDKN